MAQMPGELLPEGGVAQGKWRSVRDFPSSKPAPRRRRQTSPEHISGCEQEDSSLVLTSAKHHEESQERKFLFPTKPSLLESQELNNSVSDKEPSQNNFSKFTLLLYDIYARRLSEN